MNEALLKDLVASGAKCNIKEIVFIARDETNQLVWLEEGNESAGLRHIIKGHSADYQKAFGIDEKDIPKLLEQVISKGRVIICREVLKNGKKGFEKIYDYYDNYYIVSGIGTNGFIVSAYPVSK